MNSPALSAAFDRADALPDATARSTPRSERLSAALLRGAAVFWFTLTAAGQLLFACYVALFYGRAVAHGRLEEWNKVLQGGYIAGDTLGNSALVSHLLFAVIITVGGVLQLLPVVRRRWPRLHRWNGRVYLTGASIAALGGLVMIWTRNGGGDLSQHVAISINALLILTFAALALRHALARRLDVHRRWALRLFLVVSGGWFFRVGLMFWIVVNHGPVGFDPKTFTGPFLTGLSFAQFLLPLALLELYLHAQRGSAGARIGVAAVLIVLTLAMTGGIAAAAAIMWLPHM